MPSAFKSRIRAGVITNLQHKDPKEFLLDCKSLFKRRISNIMKSMEFIKCNSVFCGEFILQKADSILTEYKHFTTSNSSISKDTKLEPWFEEHIMDPIVWARRIYDFKKWVEFIQNYQLGYKHQQVYTSAGIIILWATSWNKEKESLHKCRKWR